MEDATSEGTLTLEFHGALADRFRPFGTRRGTRTRVTVNCAPTLSDLLTRLVLVNPEYAHVYDAEKRSLPEHVEVVLNDRVIELQGGLNAPLREGDVVAFLPAHAGGAIPPSA